MLGMRELLAEVARVPGIEFAGAVVGALAFVGLVLLFQICCITTSPPLWPEKEE